MKVYTTINPNGNYDEQKFAMDSWTKKYPVYSINTPDEIEKIRPLYPEIIFLENNNIVTYGKKKLTSWNAVMDAISDSGGISAFTNSDIILKDGLKFEIDEVFFKNSIFIATRWELKRRKKYPFPHGYDLVIMSPEKAKLFKNENWAIGLPWWDYWLPLSAFINGLNVYHISEEIIYHKWHETNYDKKIWQDLSKKFYEEILVKELEIEDLVSFEEYSKGVGLGTKHKIKNFIEENIIDFKQIKKLPI